MQSKIGINMDYLPIIRERESKRQKRADRAVLAGAIFAGMTMAVLSLLENIDLNKSEVTPGPNQISIGKIHRLVEDGIVLPVDEAPSASTYRQNHPIVRAKIANWIDGTWGTGNFRAQKVVKIAYEAGEATGVDPMLVLAVIAHESGFRENAKSKVGAEGYMQVWRKWHKEKFEGLGNAVTPEQNIMIGTTILKEYLDRDNWDEAKALQRYNGALDDESRGYSTNVLAMYQTLNRLYNVNVLTNSREFENEANRASKPSA